MASTQLAALAAAAGGGMTADQWLAAGAALLALALLPWAWRRLYPHLTDSAPETLSPAEHPLVEPHHAPPAPPPPADPRAHHHAGHRPGRHRS